MNIENDIHQGVEAHIRSYTHTHITQHNNLAIATHRSAGRCMYKNGINLGST
jgi:hypothetical protein